MANRIISDLIGTLKTFLRIGTIRIKNNAGVAEVRNQLDTAYNGAAASKVEFQQNANGNRLILQPHPTSSNFTLNLPQADAAGTTSDYALVSDGSGQLSFSQVSTGANAVKKQAETVLFNSSSPIAVFTPPAYAVIQTIIVDVEVAFDAVAPALSVGIAGNTGKYLSTTENELNAVATYETTPEFDEDVSPDPIIITFAPGTGGTVGTAKVTVVYANPA